MSYWESEHRRLLGHATANGRCEDCNAKPPMHEDFAATEGDQ